MCIVAQANLFRMLSVLHMMGTRKYIGLPCLVGRNKDIFAYVNNIIWMRISSWQGRAFSKVGKEVMIKYVLQVTPSYNSIVHDVERMVNTNWWGGGGNN